MNNKLALRYFAVIIFIAIIGLSAYKTYKNGNIPEERYIFNEKQEKKEEPESEIVETKEEYIILTRITYKDGYRTTIRLYSTGKLEQSTIKESTTVANEEKDKYIRIGSVTEDELKTINETIQKLSEVSFKQDNFSNSYGISVRLKAKDKVLYSLEYFDQTEVNKIYNIINKY